MLVYNIINNVDLNRYKFGKNQEGYLFKIENAPMGEISGELEYGRIGSHI